MGTQADPTLDLLQSLGDPSRYVCVKNVPVTRPHVRKNGDREIRVTPADLPAIADAVNAAVAESGSPARVTIGHIQQRPDFPEKDQPPLVGFAKDATVGTFGPANVPAVLCDLYIRRDRADVLQKYPFRSMEFDPATNRIHGVAMLVRDPWLDLGAVCYQGGHYLVTYGSIPVADPNKPDDDNFTPEEEAQYARCAKYMKKKYAKLAAYMDDAPAPGGMGGGMPSDPPPSLPYQKAIDPTVKALQDQLAAMQRAAVVANSQRLLDPIVPAVKFDYQRELTALASLPDDSARAGHVQYMLANYEKLPSFGGGFLPIHPGKPAGGDSYHTAPANHDRVLNYMRAETAAGRACTYDQAEAAVGSK